MALLVLSISTSALPALACDDCYSKTGCTPGYWKQEQHFDSWVATGYSPGDLVGDVFPVAPAELAGDSLLDALKYKGGPGELGAARILLRSSVAAVLNAAHPDVSYRAKVGWLIENVNLRLDYGNRGKMLELYEKLDYWNNFGCPLN